MSRISLLGLWLLALAGLFILACGGGPAPAPTSYDSLPDLNQRGNTAFEQKDYAKALLFYSQALKISRSLDNPKSTAVNLINMAVVYRKLKNGEKADLLLDEALVLEGISPELLSEVQFQKTLIYLENGNLDAAGSWAEKALASSASSSEGASALAARWNLRGRIALQKGNYEEAWRSASRGQDFSKKYDTPAEEANAYRLMAEVKTKQKEGEAAQEFYRKALTIDKTLGQSRKILMDLKGLAQVYNSQGKSKEALTHYQRAYEVAKNSGEEEEAALLLQRIKKLQEGASSAGEK